MTTHRPSTREEFKEKALRKLGKGALNINVTDDQVEDCIEYALQYFYDFHFDGSNIEFLKHQVSQEDIDHGYLIVDPKVLGIRKVLPAGSSIFPSTGMFSPQYQIMWAHVNSMASIEMAPYVMAQNQIQLINQILVGEVLFRYNKHQNRLYIDSDWTKYTVGNWLIVEAHVHIDPDIYTDVWNDPWLLLYTSAKIKEVWGQNLSKFEGVQILGGVTFNGPKLYDDATTEILNLEAEMLSKYSFPPIDRWA